MDANQRTAEIDFSFRTDGGDLFRLVSQNQRFKTAPGIGHAEQAEVVEIRSKLGVGQAFIEDK